MKIVMTGATGLLGRPLSARLKRDGHTLVTLTRKPSHVSEVVWNPGAEPAPREALQGADAVIHLAGEPIGSGRWNAEKKKRILDSRVLGTRHLVETLKSLPEDLRPKTLLSASAIGYYGDRGDELLVDDSASGRGFLAEVCREWERAASEGLPHGIRLVCLRTGMVLAREGGALQKLLPVFRAGMGGPVGSGRQWMSWIHVQDWLGLVVHALTNPSVRGPLNLVSPAAVTNHEFSKTLAHRLHRPSLIRTPAWALRLALGEMASLVLESQRVLPARALDSGYSFRYEALDQALTDLI